MIFSLIFLAAALFVYLYFIEPAYQDEQVMKSKQISQQSFLDNESSVIKHVKNLIDTYHGQLQIQEAVSMALPSEEDEAGALAQVYGLIQESGLQLQAVSVADNVSVVQSQSAGAANNFETKLQKSLSSVVIQLKTSGSYEEFKGFLSKLETNIRIFDLKTLNIQSALLTQQNKAAQVATTTQDFYSFDLSIATYYQNQ